MSNNTKMFRPTIKLVSKQALVNSKILPRPISTWPRLKPVDDVNSLMPSSLHLVVTFSKTTKFGFFHLFFTERATYLQILINFSSPSIHHHCFMPKRANEGNFFSAII
jgi:hypothetical protein